MIQRPRPTGVSDLDSNAAAPKTSCRPELGSAATALLPVSARCGCFWPSMITGRDDTFNDLGFDAPCPLLGLRPVIEGTGLRREAQILVPPTFLNGGR